MKQVLQGLSDGVTTLADVPASAPGAGELLIQSSVSLVSAGTERMLVEFGRGNLVSKARQQPEKVRQVLEKARTDGPLATLDAVRSKLDQPLAPGYCNVGRILEAGSAVSGFATGQRVVSNGKHAEVVAVPQNLCAAIPDQVDDETAAFTVMSAIGLQGVRLAAPTIGECVAVTGLGLIGLITVQILRAHGCRVLGIDVNPARLALARQFGAEVVDLSAGEDAVAVGEAFSRGRGMDAVLITASTASSEPVRQAAKLCRKRGRIVLVGVTGLELSRADFYEKELTFQVSCSYGPGRYDPRYEQQGHDYPIGFVRWTEQRNFEAVLDLMAAGALDMKPLISHRFDIDEAARAYDLLVSDQPSLAIILRYPDRTGEGGRRELLRRTVALGATVPLSGRGVAGFIGAGNYGGRILISAFRDAGAALHTIASAGGVSAVHYGKKFAFRQATTDTAALIADPEIDLVVISTRHDTHARFVEQSLQAGKNVFVEKPLCLTAAELERITTLATQPGAPQLMVGFNRRFAPHVIRMRELLSTVAAPKSLVMTVNAGAIPNDHWLQDPAVGGGRLLGEACHFIDLLRHLTGSAITGFDVVPLADPAGPPLPDKATVVLRFADGSVGTIHYLANGHKAYPKERLEIFCAGRILELDNFRRLRGWGWSGFSSLNLWRQDKGQAGCAAAFVGAVRNGEPSPIPLDEILEVSRVSIDVAARSAARSA
jgi:predicted dehydrogenase/threonine dehydrogenase-like Zn-dependent dehydrogenase